MEGREILIELYCAISLDESIPLDGVPFLKSKRKRKSNQTLERLLLRFDSICHLCDNYVEPRLATRDHIIPLSEGGTNRWENIALAHTSCNNNRANMPVELYRQFYRYRMSNGHWPQEYRDWHKKAGNLRQLKGEAI